MAAKKKSKSTKADPDAGMMPDARSEPQRFAEIKASAQLLDQSRGEGIVTGDDAEAFETFDEWVARMESSD